MPSTDCPDQFRKHGVFFAAMTMDDQRENHYRDHDDQLKTGHRENGEHMQGKNSNESDQNKPLLYHTQFEVTLSSAATQQPEAACHHEREPKRIHHKLWSRPECVT